MPVSITWNTTGAWGPGTGVLDAVEVDANFYSVKQAIEALETDRPEPNNIASITTNASGTQWTVHLDDGTQIGPLPIPVLQYRDRGAWQPLTAYAALDLFSVELQGMYSTNIAHTSASVFDETAASTPVAATAIAAGASYKIASLGTTNFTLIGADSNTVGVVFIATGAGTGTGTAGPLIYHKIIGTPIIDGSVITETTTVRALTLGDAERYIRTTNASEIAVAIPASATVDFAVGTTIAFEQAGTGQVSVEPDVGVVLNCAESHVPLTNGRFAVVQIKKVGSDEWTIFGNLTTA